MSPPDRTELPVETRVKQESPMQPLRSLAGVSTLTALVAVLGAALMAMLGGCEKTAPPPADTPASSTPVVMTTFYPTTYLARRIVGDLITIHNPVPPDADPIFFQPSDEDLVSYQQADLVILNGAEFEKWVESAVLPRTRVVDSSAGLDEPFLTYETSNHSHGPAGKHTHEGIDGHTWVDPVNAMAQSGAILRALAKRFPEHAETFRTNAESLMSDLAALDTRWRKLAPRLREVTLLASHPAYNYLARRYGFEITSLDLDPESQLDADARTEIAIVLSKASTDRRVILLWEGNPFPETAQQLANDHGVVSVWVSPAESLSAEAETSGEDYLTITHANLERLESALK